MSVDAVVLAGGDGAVIDPTSRFKGLLPVHGRPMVAWVVDALRASPFVAEVAVVVPTAEDLGAWADTVDKTYIILNNDELNSRQLNCPFGGALRNLYFINLKGPCGRLGSLPAP